jgi:hypothetical protein
VRAPETILHMSRYRFGREVSSVAPKPGRGLGTISLGFEEATLVLSVIEGGVADAVTLVACSRTSREAHSFDSIWLRCLSRWSTSFPTLRMTLRFLSQCPTGT